MRSSSFCVLRSNETGFLAEPRLQAFSEKSRLDSSVRGFPRSDLRGHLVFQMEFSLLQRLLFDFLFGGHLALGGELAETRLTCMMLFEPVTELLILAAENPLNVRGAVRHPSSSFERSVHESILAP